MWCVKCNHTVGSCTCGDMEERLRAFGEMTSNIVMKWCMRCDKHHEFCKCESPQWTTKRGKSQSK